MAKPKRASKSLPTSSPGKKKRANAPRKSAATLAEAPHDQVHPVQDLPHSPCPRDLISISNAVNSPLLRLPAEIRNEIFAYVVINQV
ncbi:hypothetical protein BKA58DRAFT_466866 [Alternaria rosae]|uniref:uncharacterized protein n=1 Tax=Alternaria rosae TaxID=1187941 RepID=UPI001E8DCE1A|nr:uncharacterized protein BKA58DRAFT_466866 [Alternaria rosae]KAH6879296.1 hypothetical protein BKA58DRAFT_466866 [Alternaria rosae]